MSTLRSLSTPASQSVERRTPNEFLPRERERLPQRISTRGYPPEDTQEKAGSTSTVDTSTSASTSAGEAMDVVEQEHFRLRSTLSCFNPASRRSLHATAGEIENLRRIEKAVEAEHRSEQEDLVSAIENAREEARHHQKPIRQSVKKHIQSLGEADRMMGEMVKIKHQDGKEKRELIHVEQIAEKHQKAEVIKLERKERLRQIREREKEQTLANVKLVEQHRQERQEKLQLARESVQQKRSSSHADIKRARGEIKQQIRNTKTDEHLVRCQSASEIRQGRHIPGRCGPSKTRELEIALQKVELRKQAQDDRIEHFSTIEQKSLDLVRSLEEAKGELVEKAQNVSFQRQASFHAMIAEPRTERHAGLMFRQSQTGIMLPIDDQ